MTTDQTEKTAAPGPAPAGTGAKPDQGAPARVKPDQPGSRRNPVAVFLELVFNLAIVGSVSFLGYMLYEQDKAIDVLFDQQNGMTSDRSATDARFGAMQATIAALQAELDAAREEAASLANATNAGLESLRDEITSTRLGLTNRYSAASQEWLLAEAASLLRLAEQHLLVAHDVRSAQALLIATDEILKQVDDPAIYAVRETLAGELAEVRAVQEVDVAAIYLQLGAVSSQAARLAVNNDLAAAVAAGTRVGLSGAQQEAGGFWSRIKNSIGSTLDNYLVVRRRDTPLQALMTPDQETALMQIVMLQIEQARTALLKGEQEIFNSSLGSARDSISRYLGGDTTIKTSVLFALDNLRGRRIVIEVPPLGRTRDALENILAVRENRPAEPANDTGQEPAAQ